MGIRAPAPQLVGCHTGVAYSQSDHVAHAVGEEEADRSALEQRLGLAAQHAQLDQPLAGDQGGDPCTARHSTPGRHASMAASHARRTVSQTTRCSPLELGSDRVGARHVARVAAVLGAGVHQQQLARLQLAGRGGEVQDRAVVPGGDD